MKKGLFYLMVLVFVFLGNPILRGEQDCEEGQKCSKKKVRKIKKEINLLNLMNGLNLSADQIKELLKLAKDLKALGEEMGILKKKEISKEAQNKKLQLLKEIQERILQGQEIPIRLRKELISLQRQTNPYPTREEKRKFLKYIKEMEEKASKILTKSQKEVLATYKPCLIPPKNLKDPVRIGQAEVDGKYYKILKKLRKLPNWKYDFLEEAILDELIEKYEFHHGKYEKKERKKIFSKLQEIALKTRKLTDVQFEIQKSKLEKEIKQVLYSKKEFLIQELEKNKKGYRPGKVARFLLSPSAIPLYEKRLKILATLKLKPKDLKKVKGVKGCKKCVVE